MTMTPRKNDKTALNRAPSAFWTVLNLKYVSSESSVWYYSHGETFEGDPIGKLINVEVQLKEFEGKVEAKLLVGLQNQQINYLLVMGLKTISALSLVEALLVAPKSLLTKEMSISYELFSAGNNTVVKLIPIIGGFTLDCPISSANLWRMHCFYRISQLKARIDDVPIPDAYRLAYNPDGTF